MLEAAGRMLTAVTLYSGHEVAGSTTSEVSRFAATLRIGTATSDATISAVHPIGDREWRAVFDANCLGTG